MKWVALCHDFRLTFSLVVSEMECAEYGLCHIELESPVVKVGGQDGHAWCQAVLYGLPVLTGEQVVCVSIQFAWVAGMSWI